MNLNNPLTLEERCFIAKELFGHDSLSLINLVMTDLEPIEKGKNEVFTYDKSQSDFKYIPLNIKKNAKESKIRLEIIDSIQRCNWLIQNNKCPIDKRHYFISTLKRNSELEKYEDINFQIKNEDELKKLNSSYEILFASFYNLFRNASRTATEININFQRQSSLPNNILFESKNNSHLNKQGWIEMSITDNGKGFDESYDIKDYFKLGVSTKVGGFGLYFVEKMADYLGASIRVDSKVGNTKISLYHPIYEN